MTEASSATRARSRPRPSVCASDAVRPSMTSSSPLRSASRQMKLPVGLVVLLDELVRFAAWIALGLKAGLRQELGDDVARRLVLERAHLARSASARASGRTRARAARRRRRRHRGSSVTISPLNTVDVVSSSRAPSRTSRRAADVERALVDRLALSGLALRETTRRPCTCRAGAGSSESRTSRMRRLQIGVDLRAVDEDRVQRDVPLGSCRAHASSLGIVSSLPRRSRSGLSMPFASAIARHRVASP